MGPESSGLGTVTRGLQVFGAGLAFLALDLIVPLGASLLWILLDFIGRTCCLAVPRKSRCLGLVRASLLCSWIDLALRWILPACLSYDNGSIASSIAFWAGPLPVAAQILFLIAVRRLAEYVGQPRLASAARSILIAGPCAWVFFLPVLPWALSHFDHATGPGARFLNPWGFLLLCIWITSFALAVLTARYASIIFKLSYELRKAAVDYDDNRGVRPDET
jgi:hypothetical protein